MPISATSRERNPASKTQSKFGQTTRVNAGQELEKLGSVLAQKNSPPSRM